MFYQAFVALEAEVNIQAGRIINFKHPHFEVFIYKYVEAHYLKAIAFGVLRQLLLLGE